MNRIFELKFLDRDRDFKRILKGLNRDASARGRSGSDIVAGHEALVAELEGSREMLVKTISEGLRTSGIKKIDADIVNATVSRLKERKGYLEKLYIGDMTYILEMAPKSASLNQYMNLEGVIELNEHRLRVELQEVKSEFLKELGPTEYHRKINSLLNIPVVATMAVVFVVIVSLLALFS